MQLTRCLSAVTELLVITVNKSEAGVPDPITSSVTGDPVASLDACGMLIGSNAETNVTTPVYGSDGRGRSSYEMRPVFM